MTKTAESWLVWVNIGDNETVHATSWKREGQDYVFFDGEREVCRYLASNVLRIQKL